MTNEFFILAGVSGAWLLTLTVALFLQQRFFNKIVGETKEKDLKKIFDKILGDLNENGLEIKNLKKEISVLTEDGKLHVQKIGLVRFNPFDELGGDHSFSLAVLDGNDTGIVITALHTRERTRVYSKPIEKGKCKLELSKEEQKAIAKTIKQ